MGIRQVVVVWYRMAGKFGGELNLAVWRYTFKPPIFFRVHVRMAILYHTTKFKSANISGYTICLGALKSDCVSPNWLVSSVGLSLARTNLCFKEGLFLYAITGGSGKIQLSVLSFWISFQCFLITCLI